MALQQISLSNQPNQTMTVQLVVDGNPLTLNLNIFYSYIAGYWMMNISDANGNLLLSNIPLVTGAYPAANFLSQYGYLKIGSAYLLNTGATSNDFPDSFELDQFILVWGDTAS
jgi:hypothetical protein